MLPVFWFSINRTYLLEPMWYNSVLVFLIPFVALEEAKKNLTLHLPFFLMIIFILPAEAQVSDMLGLYFDEEGLVNCAEEVPNPFDLYVILHNPSMESLVGIGAVLSLMSVTLRVILVQVFPNHCF